MRYLEQTWVGTVILVLLFVISVLLVSSLRNQHISGETQLTTGSSQTQPSPLRNEFDQPAVGQAPVSPLPLPAADAALTLANYHFSDPGVVLKHDALIGIVQWLPNRHELLLQLKSRGSAIDSIEILNLYDNTRKPLLHEQITGKPVWIDSLTSIAYLVPSQSQLANLQTGTVSTESPDYGLWLLQDNLHQDKLASNLGWSIAGSNNIVWVVDGETQELVEFNSLDRSEKNFVDLKTLGFVPSDPTSSFEIVASPDGSRLALFDNSQLVVLELKTQSSIDINLSSADALRTEPIKHRVFNAIWSPDSSQLAMILTTGSAGLLPSSFLALFDVASQRTTNIPLGYNYMTDVAWAPNSRQLLVMAVIGSQNAYDQAGLFLVDALTNDYVRVLSDLELWIGEFGAGLAWSSDGASLAVYCPTLEYAQVCLAPVKIEK
jgi:hypothetical protein